MTKQVNRPTMVRTAQTADLKFLQALARKFSNEIGPLAGPTLEAFTDNGWIRVAIENGQHAGFLATRPFLSAHGTVRPIIAAAVPLDAQRMHIGHALLIDARANAAKHHTTMLQAWCRVDLESNNFWIGEGFTAVAVRKTKNARGYASLLYRTAVRADHVPADFSTILLDKKPRGSGGRWVRLDEPENVQEISQDGRLILTEMMRHGPTAVRLMSETAVVKASLPPF